MLEAILTVDRANIGHQALRQFRIHNLRASRVLSFHSRRANANQELLKALQ
jgi:hypothetical protein